ncbi:MAG: FAD:protein FMN transferase [Pirellulales bacterium]|nr:FAD:protein FMN transferase [Pirellulales bacterium]
METVHTIVVGRKAMGCRFEVIFNLLDNSVATSIGTDALDIIEHIEEQISVYRPSSEISRINESSSTSWHDLSPDVFDLLWLAKQLHIQTNDAFDVTSGPLIKAWGFLQKQGRTPSPEKLAEAVECSGMKNIEFHEHEHKIRFKRPDVEINLGGIGKGWAIDKAVDLIEMESIENFFIHGGHSSVRSRGTRGQAGQKTEQNGWPVGLRHPLLREKRIGTITLQNKALGTSGSGTQFFIEKGQKIGHILDPRTGQPASGVLSATVLADTAAEADALATAAYILGPREIDLIAAEGSAVAAILVVKDEQNSRLTAILANLDTEQFVPNRTTPGLTVIQAKDFNQK